MFKFNKACTLATLPDVDETVPLAPKQFTRVEDLENYFLQDVDYLLSD